jgi:hypothetical protein
MTPHGDAFRDADMGLPPPNGDGTPPAAGFGLPSLEGQLAAAQGTVLAACHAPGGDVMATASSSGAIQVWASRQSGWILVHTEQVG